MKPACGRRIPIPISSCERSGGSTVDFISCGKSVAAYVQRVNPAPISQLIKSAARRRIGRSSSDQRSHCKRTWPLANDSYFKTWRN